MGSSFLLYMKEFFSYEQQFEKLESRGLIFLDREKAYEDLKLEGYYNIINGYAHFFEDSEKENEYIRGTTFNNILDLYVFDKTLRNLVYRYTATIECHIKALVAHVFSREHGVDERKYLMPSSFSPNISFAEGILRLIYECYQTIDDAKKTESNKFRKYIAHSAEVHNHVPMWILIRALTFGTTSIFYKYMKTNEKEEIASEFGLTGDQLTNMLELVVSFRNIVAHGERTFCAKLPKTRLTTNLAVTRKLSIPLNEKNQYKYGRSDFLALIISFKYLLPPIEFSGFMAELDAAIEKLSKSLNGMVMQRVKIQMGLYGTGWKNLAKLKK